MSKKIVIALAALVSVLTGTHAFAQRSEKCSSMAPASAQLHAWNNQPNVKFADRRHAPENSELRFDMAITPQLTPQQTVSLSAQPTQPIQPNLFGGTFPVDIPAAGIYGIAVSGHAWIDVVQSSAVVKSESRDFGPSCTGIHKIVYFRLQPGRVVVQVTNSAKRDVRLLILKNN